MCVRSSQLHWSTALSLSSFFSFLSPLFCGSWLSPSPRCLDMMNRERGASLLAACVLFMVLLTTGEGFAGTVGGEVQGRIVDGDRRRSGRSLFVFGDSYADTGNLAKIIGPAWNEPYGLTFPRKPAGRFSDGRVFTDYLASVFGIRSPLPYKYRKYGKKLLPYGMNFAVGGSGVFDGLFFQDNLTVQIDHFQAQVEEGVFPDLDLARSTAVVCISGNDYMFYEEAGGTLEGMRKEFIPKLIEQLKSDLKRLRQLGVGKVAATSLHPIGCVPRMSSSFAYRSCNQTVNLAVMYHNGLLAEAVSELINGAAAAGGGDDQNSSNSTTAPAAPFVIVDLYDAFTTVLNKEMKKSGDALRPCCQGVGGAGDNNCGSTDGNGTAMYEVCEAPQRRFYWDAVHPTQAAWRAVFSTLGASLNSLLS